jgi:hypothetical protein
LKTGRGLPSEEEEGSTRETSSSKMACRRKRVSVSLRSSMGKKTERETGKSRGKEEKEEKERKRNERCG